MATIRNAGKGNRSIINTPEVIQEVKAEELIIQVVEEQPLDKRNKRDTKSTNKFGGK
jgi:hypothetical protein